MKAKDELKMAVISGAHHALRYKEKNPRATDAEIMRYITNESLTIIEKIDKD